MTLGFFILSALDLLGAGPEVFSETERRDFATWILRCQHPNGGFCGSPNHRFPDAFYLDVGHGNQQMDPANLPATFFAILSLSFVGTFEGLRRAACLKWLKSLQRENGSFGELITQNGVIEGGTDMRYCYVAAAVRWMLRGDVKSGGILEEEDINVESLINHIRSGQTYDGGISESSHHEAHAGYTYCAVGALSFLGRLPNPADSAPALTNIPSTIRWLVSRQVGYSEEETGSPPPLRIKLAGVFEEKARDSDIFFDDSQFVGFNGRCNKMVDTCYAFWVTGSLKILGQENTELVNVPSIRRFLCQQTQHVIGGFGKYPRNPPDIYHSYLGLAALSIMNEAGLKSLDAALCVSTEQRQKVEQLRNSASIPTMTYWKNGYSFLIRKDDPDFEAKMAASEHASAGTISPAPKAGDKMQTLRL